MENIQPGMKPEQKKDLPEQNQDIRKVEIPKEERQEEEVKKEDHVHDDTCGCDR